MFSNISYQDKEAFFGLLDEYFESRPHLLNGGGGGSRGYTSPVSAAGPTRVPSSGGGRTLPPQAPSSSRSPPPLLSPPASANGAGNYEKPDMATRMVMSGLKLGSSGARKGLGMLSNNQQAMDALGRAGAQGMIRSAQAGLGPAKGGQQQQDVQNPSSPTATMTQRTTTINPPPGRRAPAQVVQTTQVQVNSSQATAVYDYSSPDSGDLSVQAGQVVNVIEKTSDDWWTCEDGSGRQGLVPASYLK